MQEEPIRDRAADLLDDVAAWLKSDHGPDDRDEKPARKRP